ncbi:Phenylalanine--tRNA ligase, chloroplastic/mitochondrial [Morella rubra]|uniref:Phenylalanine--tRNA ligase, chloroplastic/mitochondrial n=1 Tax=Morella rubra TaxID=262757 RepID=A0A6A1UK87_9ROSI|nr:Phenylalanine--tRNA ligase, chloroplastic/mitochondrial [Morella rubra]
MAMSVAHATLRTSLFLSRNGLRSIHCIILLSTLHRKKWRQPVASVLEVGGVKIGREDVVRDDPTNNVPDTVFSKLGMQLHRRDQHPIGILKNAIYEYFDTSYSNKFDKFDNLCPIVTVKQGEITSQNFHFCKLLLVSKIHEEHKFQIRLLIHVAMIWSYNDTYYVDSQTVLRCHTSAHQAELLRNGHTHFLVTGDVYRRDSIDSTKPSVSSGSVEMRWIDTYFPFTNPSFELEIYFQVSYITLFDDLV